MKPLVDFPAERITWFQFKLGITPQDIHIIKQFRDLFIGKKKEFATYFYSYFNEIEDAKFFLEHERRSGHLKVVWEEWFEGLFKEDLERQFLTHMWRSGLRHVEIHIDHRFIALGYSVVRQFCRDIVRTEIPEANQKSVSAVVDKLVDFCLLIETHAFIEATSKCDIEVIRGIAHQVRNPLTVIGGNAYRLLRNVGSGAWSRKACETIMEENRRLEKMVKDVQVYSDMYQRETDYSMLTLDAIIPDALEELRSKRGIKEIPHEITFDLSGVLIHGDQEDLRTMFYYLLENCIDAAGSESPYIRLSMRPPTTAPSSFVEIEIFNRGEPPEAEEINNFFVPFHSSKPYGTGFGLPIAQLAARRSFGDIHIEPVPDEGTRCIIKLPVPIPGREDT